MTQTTRVLLYLFCATVVVASCAGESPLLGPAPIEEEAAMALSAAADCPAAPEVCEELRTIVREACPPDGAYKNDAEYDNCRRTAFREAAKTYKRCFTGEQMNAIKRCVFDVPGRTAERGPDAKPREEPRE